MKSILDPSFRYTPSHATDIRKRFEEIRRQQEEERQKRKDSAPAAAVVRRIKR